MASKVLIKSVSGIRGIVGKGLTPVLAATYAAGFGTMLKRGTLVVGRDSRTSGEMIAHAVVSGLVATGLKVIYVGVVPTPTVEIAVNELGAAGGICVTASHNPAPWNALKFFNKRGEFITPKEYEKLDAIVAKGEFAWKPSDKLGKIGSETDWIDKHIYRVLKLKTVNRRKIKKAKLTVVVDAVNGAGSFALPPLLEQLGVKVRQINCEGTGNFTHEPEPIAENLGQLSQAVRKHKANLGMACDPDADRLALVDDKGRPIGEELTLTIAVRQVLRKNRGSTVINLSTSRATADVAESLGSKVYYSPVGETNVVQAMRQRKAVIGGEGNGGVIYPASHAGRDALVGAALVLSCLAEEEMTLSELVETLPKYYTIKAKAEPPSDFPARLKSFSTKAASLLGKCKVDRRDGLRFDFEHGWVQIRSSNTEPIFRLIVETDSDQLTRQLSHDVMAHFKA
jgi:phosphomannomutase